MTIDSYYLTLSLEYGVIGLLLYVGSLLTGVAIALRLALSRADHDREGALIVPATISLLNFLVIKAVFSQQDNHPVIFMILGLVTALAYRARSSEPAQSEQARS